MFGWSDKATTAKVKYHIGGDAPARVVTIGYGQYEVTIPNDPDADVTYKKPRDSRADPRHAFPNMEVVDGSMSIPLDDIVSAVLARVKPAEIAVSLWADEEVRNEFIYAMTTRYNSDNISDTDRRKFLSEVKEAVHSAALDRLAGAMAKLEYDYAGKFSVWRAVDQINSTLAHYEVTRPPRGDEDGPQPLRIKDPTIGDQFKIGGEAWTEARNHWRDEVALLFPAQGIEAGTAETGTGSVHESPVGAADAPERTPHEQI